MTETKIFATDHWVNNVNKRNSTIKVWAEATWTVHKERSYAAERSYASAVKKDNSNDNLYLRRALSKTNIQDKTQRPIVQQLDIRNNENTF